MLLKRNLLENLTILSSGGTIVCVLLNYVTNISLITGVWFHLYILLIFIVSVLLSFKCIQWLLRLNKPLKYDAETLVKEYPYLAVLTRFLPEPKKRVPYVWKEYDTNELSVISTVLERKLVSSWYVPYVSQEIGFPFACKQMLDQMIAKAFKICNKIETKDVFIDMCTILITHFKEYKKAMKRQEKSPENSIESLYKTSHPISEPNTKYTTADHCTNILRIVIKDLLPWELWDTPHSELLVRILSKKLDSFIENTLADPIWINNKLMTYLTGKEYEESVETEKLDDDKKDAIPEKIITPVVKTEVKEEVNVKPQEDVMKLANIVEEQAVDITPSLDVKSSPVLRQRRGRQGRNEVKIYDRIIEGSVKTWETDMDLQCISLGQDLLASLDGEITLSRLWGQDTEPEGSPERPGGKSPQPLWFGEEDTISPEAAERASPRPAVLSELQHTVSHAKTRIGDLQDEAAGMMEGLLDFGIAGLKKGLRFTGLSDDSQDKSSFQRDKSERSSPEARHKNTTDTLATTLIHKDGDTSNGAPHLVKQHRVTSQDSVPIPVTGAGPPDSPEPQYEEAADLSSSIAKLRCLLRQAGDPAQRAEEVWWQGAEETRGRTQHQHSSRAVDTATLADEYDMSLDRGTSPNQAGNNMQRLDKLFQRTVTGVFNSLKTAVGGEEECGGAGEREWSYVCGAGDRGAGHAAARWQAAARARPRVDSALDPLQLPRSPPTRHDAVDIDEYTAICLGAWSGACGVASAATDARHVTVRLATLVLAELSEVLITIWLDELGAWLRRRAFVVAGCDVTVHRATTAVNVDRTVDAVLDTFPVLQVILGRSAARQCVRVAASSAAHARVSRDVAYRALDLLVLHAHSDHAGVTPL